MTPKPVKRVDLSQFTPEQKAAIIATIKNAKAAAATPQLQEEAQTAQQVFQQLMSSPIWQVWQAPPPDDGKPPELWHVGAPKIIDERPPEEA